MKDSVSKAYYAMFHASVAILYHYGLTAKSHAGTIYLFDEHLVKKGIVDTEAGQSLRKAFTLRQLSDYDVQSEFDKKTVEELIVHADSFIVQIKAVLGL